MGLPVSQTSAAGTDQETIRVIRHGLQLLFAAAGFRFLFVAVAAKLVRPTVEHRTSDGIAVEANSGVVCTLELELM